MENLASQVQDLLFTLFLSGLRMEKPIADILEAYPFLTEDDIRAAVSYARLTIEREDVIPLEVVT